MIFFEHVFYFYKKFWITILFCVVIYHFFYLIWHHFFYLATFSLSPKQKKKKNLLYLHIFSIPIIFYHPTFSPLFHLLHFNPKNQTDLRQSPVCSSSTQSTVLVIGKGWSIFLKIGLQRSM